MAKSGQFVRLSPFPSMEQLASPVVLPVEVVMQVLGLVQLVLLARNSSAMELVNYVPIILSILMEQDHVKLVPLA